MATEQSVLAAPAPAWTPESRRAAAINFPSAGPVLVGSLLSAGLLIAYAAAFHGDVSAFVCLGRDMVGLPPFEAVRSGFPPPGYDGQFYYAVARNPCCAHLHEVDNPVRHLRVFYPALCWLCSGGDGERLLWVMPAVNVAAIAALVWLGARVALRCGMNPWWALLLPIGVNAGMPALRNLTDVVAILGSVGLIAAWMRRSSWPILFLWAAAAVLAREQNALLVLIVLVAAFCDGRSGAFLGLAAVLFLWVAWFLAVHQAYGAWPFVAASENLGRPLAGMISRWQKVDLTGNQVSGGIHFLRMVHLTIEIGAALSLMAWRRRAVTTAFMLLGVAMAVCGGTALYQDAWGYTRVFAWLPAGIWLRSMQDRQGWPAVLLLPAILWPIVAVVQVWTW